MTRTSKGPAWPSTLHVAYSLSCNLACRHCIFRSGPGVGPTMGMERAEAFLGDAHRAGIRRIVFTGGEPFLYARELRRLVRCAAGKGLESAVVTSASWASSRSRTRAFLADFKEVGLASITLSTDRYHLLTVPFANLQLVLETAGEIGLPAGVKISRLARDPVAEGLFRALRSMTERVVVQEISPLGRASALRSAVRLHPPSSFTGAGCATPPLLLPEGDLLTCCNLPARDLRHTDFPFILGNVGREPLRSLLEKRSTDPLLQALRSRGPGDLVKALGRMAPSAEDPARFRYHSRCDLCFHLFGKRDDKSPLYASLSQQTDTRHAGLGACL